MNKLFTAAAVSSLALSIGCAPPGPYPVKWYVDIDGDGYGDENDLNPVSSVTDPSGANDYSENNDDCDDADPNNFPRNQEDVFDGQDNNCNGVVDEKTYAIGDTGPAGGVIVGEGYYVSDLTYFEAATTDITVEGDFYHRFGCNEQTLGLGGDWHLDAGAGNTQTIVDLCSEAGIAARLADDYVQNGFDDWFLPSRDEALLMRDAVDAGHQLGLMSELYWSSSGGWGCVMADLWQCIPETYFESVEGVCMDLAGSCDREPAFNGWVGRYTSFKIHESGELRVRAVRTFSTL